MLGDGVVSGGVQRVDPRPLVRRGGVPRPTGGPHQGTHRRGHHRGKAFLVMLNVDIYMEVIIYRRMEI